MSARILIIEDEEKLRRVMELQLRTAGFEVEQAGAAEDGLRLADSADLIITDLRLPGMDGLQLLSSLRERGSQTPIVVMTAFGSIENGRRSDEGRSGGLSCPSRFRSII